MGGERAAMSSTPNDHHDKKCGGPPCIVHAHTDFGSTAKHHRPESGRRRGRSRPNPAPAHDMTRAAPRFNLRAFDHGRARHRPAPPPITPASPHILGVDSDDEFSNLNSAFATLANVPSLSSPFADQPQGDPFQAQTSPEHPILSPQEAASSSSPQHSMSSSFPMSLPTSSMHTIATSALPRRVTAPPLPRRSIASPLPSRAIVPPWQRRAIAPTSSQRSIPSPSSQAAIGPRLQGRAVPQPPTQISPRLSRVTPPPLPRPWISPQVVSRATLPSTVPLATSPTATSRSPSPFRPLLLLASESEHEPVAIGSAEDRIQHGSDPVMEHRAASLQDRADPPPQSPPPPAAARVLHLAQERRPGAELGDGRAAPRARPKPRYSGAAPHQPSATESHPAWFERGSHRLSPAPASVSPPTAPSIPDDRRQYLLDKAKLVSQRHLGEIDSLKQQIQKLKASLRAPPPPEPVVTGSPIDFDHCLPIAFGENSRLVRRALDEQLDNNSRIEAMLSKVAFVLESGSYSDDYQSRIDAAFASRETKSAQDRLMTAEIRIKELVTENSALSKQVVAKEERIKTVQEESRVLCETLRKSLEQETFERKRMNSLYDEERHVLNASLRETIQDLAAENQRYRVRLLDAGVPAD